MTGADRPGDAPVFVVGTGRSGTTLLQALIGSHERICAPPEVHFYYRIAAHEAMWGDLNDDAVLRRVVTETVDAPLLAGCGFDAVRVFERARQGPRTYAGVLDAAMRDFADREGKPRWSEKSPLQPVAWIWSAFPEAQVVHIVRDPRPTIASNLAKLGVWKNATQAAIGWRWFTQNTIRAGEARGPQQYLRVRYEDLVRDPVTVMGRVFAFLGEDFDPSTIERPELRQTSVLAPSSSPLTSRVLEPIKADDVPADEAPLSRPNRYRVSALVAPAMAAAGYEAVPLRTRAVGRVLVLASLPRWAARQGWRTMTSRLRTPEQQRASIQRREQRQLRRRKKRAERRRAG